MKKEHAYLWENGPAEEAMNNVERTHEFYHGIKETIRFSRFFSVLLYLTCVLSGFYVTDIMYWKNRIQNCMLCVHIKSR